MDDDAADKDANMVATAIDITQSDFTNAETLCRFLKSIDINYSVKSINNRLYSIS